MNNTNNKKNRTFSSVKYSLTGNFLTLFYVLATFIIAVCVSFGGINIIIVFEWEWFWLALFFWCAVFALPCQILTLYTLKIIDKLKE